VARALSQLLENGFIDLDQHITETQGRTPQEIIEREGEHRFRELETRALESVLSGEGPLIIALGGGTWTDPRNRELINSLGALTVWLDTPFEICWKRIEAAPATRPLARSRQEAERLFEARLPIYELAEARIPVANDDPRNIALRIATTFFLSPPET